jgi:hypothetical protein
MAVTAVRRRRLRPFGTSGASRRELGDVGAEIRRELGSRNKVVEVRERSWKSIPSAREYRLPALNFQSVASRRFVVEESQLACEADVGQGHVRPGQDLA